MKLVPKWKAGIPMIKIGIRSKKDRRQELLHDPDVIGLMKTAWQDGLLQLSQTFEDFLSSINQ